ncbi:Sas10 C-terminal domain-containing protein [Lipomyces arxii]|uniref:Sas10 C-terminal domain-containing protein n=1 Tax=Lipomyces arxii TaxID=56418 RepID=UPI0034CD3864
MAGRTLSRKSALADTWDGMEHDEVDQFHEQREKILLGDDSSLQFQDLEASDEEVLEVREAEESDDGDEQDSESEVEEELKKSPSKPKKEGRNLKTAEAKVDSDDDDDWRGIQQKYVEDDELTGWGQSARAYYDANEISEEEDAKEEEETAVKIQQKVLADMNTSDFLGDFEDEMKDAAALENEKFLIAVKEVIPKQDISQLSQPEKLQLLRSRNPEVFPLSKEFTELLAVYDKMTESAANSSISSVKFVALSSYLASISAYFTLFCDETFDEDVVRDNQVMNHILVLRRYWQRISHIPDSDTVSEKTFLPELVYSDDSNKEQEDDLKETCAKEEQEESEIENVEGPSFADLQKATLPKRKRSQRTTRLDDTMLDLDLDISAIPLSKKKKISPSTANDFADVSALDQVDLDDKIIKRKTLRFYTSKIDKKSRLRKEHFAGDADLPYREREKERQTRLSQLAQMRGQSKAVEGDEDYLDGSDGPDQPVDHFDGEKPVASLNDANGSGSEKDYYDMVKSTKLQKKVDIEDLRISLKKAARDGKLKDFEKEVGQDGKRAINYQILKNKGLTPKRNKDSRNSRVKKRKKYEKAKKKLASMKQVYKKPEGPYTGERTGIKKNISRSTKFR